MYRERLGECGPGSARIVFAREDIHHYVGGFETDRKASRSPSRVPGAGIERNIRPYHGRGREAGVSLAVRAAFAYRLDQARGLPYRIPMDTVLPCRHDSSADAIARRRKLIDQNLDWLSAVVVFRHGRPDADGEVLFARQFADAAQHLQRLGAADPARVIPTRLRPDAHPLPLAASP